MKKLLKSSKKAVSLLLLLLFLFAAGIILSKDKTEKILPVSSFSDQRPVLIIDAGHGGADGGAVAKNGIIESEINLAIAKKLECMAKLFGFETVMTRSSEQLDYPENADSIKAKKQWDQNTRAELISSFDQAIFLSIHQNTYPDPRPSGPQVLYGRQAGSDELGELIQAALCEYLCPDSRRLAAPVKDSIFLMKSSENTSVLVECGFISNEKELNLLLDESYQRSIALVLTGCIIRFLS